MSTHRSPGQTAYETVSAQFSPDELHAFAAEKTDFSRLTPEQRSKWDVVAESIAQIGNPFPPPPPPPPTKEAPDTTTASTTKAKR